MGVREESLIPEVQGSLAQRLSLPLTITRNGHFLARKWSLVLQKAEDADKPRPSIRQRPSHIVGFRCTYPVKANVNPTILIQGGGHP